MKNEFELVEILKDIKKNLKLTLTERDLHYFTTGESGSIVFSIKNQYLIKICSKNELLAYQEFLSRYNSEYFQKIKYINFDLNYVCLFFLVGDNYQDNLDRKNLVKSLYKITSSYQDIDYDGFGYLFEDHKTWSKFLKDEIEYSGSVLKTNSINKNKVYEALNMVSKYNVRHALLHGDLGVHNFIVNNSKLYIIDPMGLVGDPIYDFYFAIFSSATIFQTIPIRKLLDYFDYDINYKKIMIVIVFYIRLCRAYKYDEENFKIYLQYYNHEITTIPIKHIP